MWQISESIWSYYWQVHRRALVFSLILSPARYISFFQFRPALWWCMEFLLSCVHNLFWASQDSCGTNFSVVTVPTLVFWSCSWMMPPSIMSTSESLRTTFGGAVLSEGSLCLNGKVIPTPKQEISFWVDFCKLKEVKLSLMSLLQLEGGYYWHFVTIYVSWVFALLL